MPILAQEGETASAESQLLSQIMDEWPLHSAQVSVSNGNTSTGLQNFYLSKK